MDYLLPDETTMHIMSEEYERLRLSGSVHPFTYEPPTYSLEDTVCIDDFDSLSSPEGNKAPTVYDRLDASDSAPLSNVCPQSLNSATSAHISIMLIILYFIKNLRYNNRYGTQIYDSHRSVGRVRSHEFAFGQLNNLF